MTGAPTLAGGLPWLGHALALGRDPVELLERGRRRFGELFRFRLSGKWTWLFSGPAANEAFFRAPDDQFNAREAYRFMVPIFGKGVAYDVSPETMDEQLGLVFPALREERLQAYVEFMTAETEGYCDQLGESGEFDLLAATNEITTYIASRCLIGHEFRQNLSGEFASLYHDLEGGINLVAFFQPYLPLPKMIRRDRARRRIQELISGIIARRRAADVAGVDFLETLMTAHYSDGRALDDQTITGMLLSLIFAGQHTSAVLAAWSGILLFQHRQYLPAILDELSQSEAAGAVTLAGLKRLVRLERAIKEAERLHPPLIMLMRTVMRDFEYGGMRIPPGDLVMVSPAVSHRIPEVFPDPHRYDPDRYAPGRDEDRKFNYSLIGFGGGKHRCIGLTFAYLQVKAIWRVLLNRFDFEMVSSESLPDYATFVVGPKRPCLVRYRRRATKSRQAGPHEPSHSQTTPAGV